MLSLKGQLLVLFDVVVGIGLGAFADLLGPAQ